MRDPHDAPTGGLNRRRMIKAAAWTAPAITVISAAPAFAFSGLAQPTIGSLVGARVTPGATSNYTYWTPYSGTPTLTAHPGASTDRQTNSRVNLTFSSMTVSGGGTGTLTLTVIAPKGVDQSFAFFGIVKGRPVLYPGSVSGVGWVASTPTCNATTDAVTFVFTYAMTTPGVIPNLSFSFITPGSANGDTLYTYPTGKAVTATLAASGTSKIGTATYTS